MKTIRSTLILFTLVLIPVASFSQAAEKNGNHRMWCALELNEEQQEKLKTLHNEFEPLKKEHFKEVREIRKKIKDELLKENPSQGDLDRQAQELGNLHTRISQERTNHLLKVKEILTQEQFSKLVSKEEFSRNRARKKSGKSTHGKKMKSSVQ
ncbi:MAG TPA: periplasmic heavy metal sensor [Chitinispirillaceae bacterium]|jgi:Spy/CpxP family protein refolding chaperone|nr:periplasmic heavy metal sensor [Chitinispirillaceae bacterium]